jgi:hypothetical protein
MRVRNLDTKGNTLAAAFTFSHGTCTSCSEVRNQNNQLDYCSRLPGKMQAFFQKILRFFGKPNSFSHRCAMPAVPLLALCATSPGRDRFSPRRGEMSPQVTKRGTDVAPATKRGMGGIASAMTKGVSTDATAAIGRVHIK